MKKVTFTGLLFILSFTMASAQVKLAFNPAQGAKYDYQTEMTQTIKQNVMGQEIPTESTMNVNYLMEITDKSPQETKVQLTYREVVSKITNPMMKMAYDSKKPEESTSDMDKMLAKIFSVLIDKPFVLTVSPDGSIKSVTGMEAVTESMAKAVSGDGQMAQQMGEQMKQQFSGDFLKKTFEQSFKMYPPNAAKAGDSWNTENAMDMNGMKMNIKTKYTLKGINNNRATIASEGAIEMVPGAGLEGKLTGTQSGTTIIDTVSGLPVSSDMAQNVKGAVKAQGMDIQMELISKAKTSIKAL